MTARGEIIARLKSDISRIEKAECDSASFPEVSQSLVERCSEESIKYFPDVVSNDPSDAMRGDTQNYKNASKAFQKIVNWLSVRERSTGYVRERLKRDGFGSDNIEEALERAIECHILDDARYADSLIRTTMSSGRGMRDIEREIEELGIDINGLDAWEEYQQLGCEGELKRALDVLKRKPPHAKNACDAAYRKLVSRGFSSEIASSAARLWLDDERVL